MNISVVMPTFNQSAFISCAIQSLINQTHTDWELIIIIDGCTDNTEEVVNAFLHDGRIRYYKNAENKGIGSSINRGIDLAGYEYITYLPSDDIIFPQHLESLTHIFINDPDIILTYSGVKLINYNLSGIIETDFKGTVKEYGLQPVQVMHKKVREKWAERDEFVTGDYFQMYWKKLLPLGAFIPTGLITCQWVDHPDQRHKKISQNHGGGLNAYRNYYKVKAPIIFKSSESGIHDELKLYRNFRREYPKADRSLKILLVGELSFNPERIYALEEAGHELYGLWIGKPWWFHMVGPVPFGQIRDLSQENWREEIEIIKPDIIYALLNTLAIPLATEVLKHCSAIPFVWHFKEGPFYCRQTGLWNSLKHLQTKADGVIYLNDDIRKFYNICFPTGKGIDYMILDGDLPKKEWFKNIKKPLLSENGRGFHTVVPGRPYGIKAIHISILAKSNIHFHFYGENWHGQWDHFVKSAKELAPGHIHLHPDCTQENWTEELSQYDAGWLHYFESRNHGDYLRTNWDDLNIPARMTTLAAAGLPMLQRDNSEHIVATQTICKGLDIGVFFKDFNELGSVFGNKELMKKLRNNVWENRMKFTFDYHVPELIEFFRRVISRKKEKVK